MNGIIALAGGEQTGNVGVLIVINPKSAHRVMHAREDAHRHMLRIVADEHLVDFEDRAKLSFERFGWDVREIEIHLVLAIHTHSLQTHFENFARRNVARHEVAVSGILFFEEVQTLVFGNR